MDEFGVQLIPLPDHDDRHIAIPTGQPAHILAVGWETQSNGVIKRFRNLNNANVLLSKRVLRNKLFEDRVKTG